MVRVTKCAKWLPVIRGGCGIGVVTTRTKLIIYINWYKWTLMALYFLVNSIGNDGEVAPSASSEHVLEEVSNLNCFEIHVRARNF